MSEFVGIDIKPEDLTFRVHRSKSKGPDAFFNIETSIKYNKKHYFFLISKTYEDVTTFIEEVADKGILGIIPVLYLTSMGFNRSEIESNLETILSNIGKKPVVFRKMIDEKILKNSCKWEKGVVPDEKTYYSMADVSLAGWVVTLATVAPVVYLTNYG